MLTVDGAGPGDAGLKVVQVVALVSRQGVFGGPTTVALSQSGELQARGHHVVLVGLHDGPTAPRSVDGVAVRLVKARTFVPGLGVIGTFNLRLPLILWKEIGQADIVHVHTGRDLVSLVALGVARLRRRPYVAQTHGMVMPRSGLLQRLVDLVLCPLLRAGRYRLVLTDDEAAGLQALLPEAPTTRLANGVALPDDARRTPCPRPRIVFLARLHPRKRVLRFAEMASELMRRGVAADFAVYGPDEGDLAALDDAIGAGAPVHYVGAVAHEDALRVLAGADVYVLPSVDEPFPMTVLEALARSTPCVLVDSCGLAGTVGTRAGVSVTDGSVIGLADAVESMLADWPAASRAARRTAEQLFGVGAVADRLLSLYAPVG